ncbi:MAG: hypothetical protein H3C48_10555 [Chitinophagaceae bacterium]|nr:hypothetical protein [Chitinophagaceae bacterium]
MEEGVEDVQPSVEDISDKKITGQKFGKSEEDLLNLIAQIIVEYILNEEL